MDSVITPSATATGAAPQAEWIRVPDAVRRFGISRTKLYQLAGAGRVRTVSLRDEGMTKATRLFHVESLRRFIESFEGEGGSEQ